MRYVESYWNFICDVKKWRCCCMFLSFRICKRHTGQVNPKPAENARVKIFEFA